MNNFNFKQGEVITIPANFSFVTEQIFRINFQIFCCDSIKFNFAMQNQIGIQRVVVKRRGYTNCTVNTGSIRKIWILPILLLAHKNCCCFIVVCTVQCSNIFAVTAIADYQQNKHLKISENNSGWNMKSRSFSFLFF